MLALLYLGLAICVGERLCSRYFRFVSVAHRWATGALVGLLLSTGFTYLAARHLAGTSNPLLWGDLLFFAAAALFLLKCPPGAPLRVEPRVSGSAGWDWVTLGLYFVLVTWMMFATLDLKAGTLLIGVTQWSDYGPNTAIVRSFAAGHNFPAEYPHFAGEAIRYHFLFYFQAGNLEFLGLNLVWSLNLLSILTLVCLLALIMALGQLLFRSRAVGCLASALFFFHGTLNLVPFLRSQTSFKGALLAIYNLRDYLSSGFTYRGEAWGIWTQVVYVNQRHLASAIGIFLVVLIFLFDRYLERARQKKLARALRAPIGPRTWPAATRRVLAPWIPTGFLSRRPRRESPLVELGATSDKPASLEQFPEAPHTGPVSEVETSATSSISEAQPSDMVVSLEGSSQGPADSSVVEPQTSETGANDEQAPPVLESGSVSEAQSSATVVSLEGSSQASNDSPVLEAQASETRTREQSPPVLDSAVNETQTSDTVAPSEGSSQAANDSSAVGAQPSETGTHEQSPPVLDSAAVTEAQSSAALESPEESPPAANYASEREPRTSDTVAYDEYMRQESDPISESEAQESEALEFAQQSSQEHNDAPVADMPAIGSLPPPEPRSREAVVASVSDEPSSQASDPGPVDKPSRGLIADLVHDNLVHGRGFIFSGLLLGALPYWNAPVFTAAFAVLLFLFVLFPYRRYMMGLAITAAVVALPQVLSLRSGNTRAGASLIHWGYTMGNAPISQVLEYLGFTFGVKWVLILVGLIFGSWLHLRLFIAIFSLFLLTFCFQFSEEALANHKFLNIWLVVANLFVAYGLWRLWHLRIKGWAIPSRLVAILLASPIVAGGIIDFFPIHNATFIHTGFTNDRLIKWIQAETKPDSVFLTDKFVNHPILLGGRRIFFGYTYFTWSAGYDLPKRESAYRQMFESKNAHQVFTLLKANGIDYVAFDAGVRGVFKNLNEQQVYAPNFKKVFDGTDYWSLTIYKVPENADFVPASTAAAAAAVPGATPAPGPSVFDGGLGKENGQFNFPRGLAVDNAGNIFVADTNNGRVQKFSPTGEFLSVIGKAGQGPGEFREPGGIAVDSSGNIYVADVSGNCVKKLKPDGTFLAEWKGPEPGFYGPRAISIGPDNSVYVIDQGHAQIVKFDPNGKVLATWGASGQGDGEFAEASSVAVDGKNNRVYVGDPRNRRIEVFDTNGKFITKWPIEQWGPPSGWHFQGVAVDPQSGQVYASCPTDEVLVFDLTGKKIGSLRPNPPDKLEGPSSVALIKGKIYVLNTFGNRVSRIALETK